MNKRVQKLLSVLVAVLLLVSALPVTALAVGGSTDITATVKHPRTLTVLPHPGGQVIVLAPDPLHDGDTVVFTLTPDRGYKISAVYLNGRDVTAQLVNNTFTAVVDGDMVFQAVFARKYVPSDDSKAVEAPKTGDFGLALYGVLSVSALMGMVWVGKKKKH